MQIISGAALSVKKIGGCAAVKEQIFQYDYMFISEKKKVLIPSIFLYLGHKGA